MVVISIPSARRFALFIINDTHPLAFDDFSRWSEFYLNYVMIARRVIDCIALKRYNPFYNILSGNERNYACGI